MAIVMGDLYLEKLVKFLEEQAELLIEGTKVLKLNPAGLHYVHLRLEALQELERMLSGAPVDYLRSYVSDLGDYRALEQLRRILRFLTSLKVVSALPPPARDPTPLSLLPFGRLKVLELRGCDLSSSAAKGLLELRRTLEKIICHNSTDALRHVFASRISEIKVSPQWNKLSFVSCACNRLVLMDESLQLLPVVETLDLSRNKFAKVDNLLRCTKLKHLDLGFNHLRTISHFTEVSCHIVKLVLRNNALTSLRGIKNLKSLEGLDVSYNIISKLSELEFLGSLSLLKSLWLEGNPLCCARQYRAHVFSYFLYPHNLKLDGKEISTREFWKRQRIVARRQKQPPSFGFYSPARDDAEEEESCNRKKKKCSHLASIDSEEESTYVGSDLESSSCDHEIQNKDDNVKADNESEILDLIDKVEHLKKEHSVLWLREFKEWMDRSSEDFADVSNYNWGIHPEKNHYTKIKKKQKHHHGESSRYALGSVHASGDESNTNTLESYDSFANLPMNSGALNASGETSSLGTQRMNLNGEHQKFSHEERGPISVRPNNLHLETFIMKGQRTAENDNATTLNAIDDTAGSRSSSAYLGPPPHYQKDVLHRRHSLVEEILQRSADSYSVASSDSMTSCSEDNIYDSEQSIHEDDQFVQRFFNKTEEQRLISGIIKNNAYQQQKEIPGFTQTRTPLPASQSDNTSSIIETWNTDQRDAELVPCFNQNSDGFEKRKSIRKPKKRAVSLLEDNNVATNRETSQRSDPNICGASSEDEGNGHFSKQIQENTATASLGDNNGRLSGTEYMPSGWNDLVKDYFRKDVADSSTQETCRCFMHCDYVLEQDSTYKQREVVLLLSSKNKLYMLLVGVALDGGTKVSLVATHRVEDIRNVSVGLGLQVVRIHIEEGSVYHFITKSIERSTELLNVLQVFDSQAVKAKCSLRSLEHVQVELFEKQICGGFKLSIFQYTMLHFLCSTFEEESWLPRSLFVAGGNLFVCIEDFMQFSTLLVNPCTASYFSLQSCCSISDVSEMVIESKERRSLTLAIKRVESEFCRPSVKPNKNPTANDRIKKTCVSATWKLRWFSEESLFKFVALLKALHADTKEHPLLVRHLD